MDATRYIPRMHPYHHCLCPVGNCRVEAQLESTSLFHAPLLEELLAAGLPREWVTWVVLEVLKVAVRLYEVAFLFCQREKLVIRFKWDFPLLVPYLLFAHCLILIVLLWTFLMSVIKHETQWDIFQHVTAENVREGFCYERPNMLCERIMLCLPLSLSPLPDLTKSACWHRDPEIALTAEATISGFQKSAIPECRMRVCGRFCNPEIFWIATPRSKWTKDSVRGQQPVLAPVASIHALKLHL